MENLVAMTGASGVIIGAQLPKALSEQGEHSVHLILRRGAEAVIAQEFDADVPLPAIGSMHLAKRAGAIILPPVMAYCPRPQTVGEVTEFFVGEALDALGLGHNMHRQWGESR